MKRTDKEQSFVAQPSGQCRGKTKETGGVGKTMLDIILCAQYIFHLEHRDGRRPRVQYGGRSKIQGYIFTLKLWNDRPTEPHANQTLRYSQEPYLPHVFPCYHVQKREKEQKFPYYGTR